MSGSDKRPGGRRQIKGGFLSEVVNCYFCQKLIEDAINAEFKLISNPYQKIELRGVLCPDCTKVLKDFIESRKIVREEKKSV